MNEIEIKFSMESPQEKGSKILVTAVNDSDENILYKFLIGYDGTWNILRDFGREETLEWVPEAEGKYTIMVQAKRENSIKSFDYVSRADFNIGKLEKPQLIEETAVEEKPDTEEKPNANKKLEITGFKCLTYDVIVNSELIFQVDTSSKDNSTILYKFIKINSEGKAKCIQNYSSNKMVSYSEERSGEYKLLCMIKDRDSKREYEDRAIINYKVKPYNDVIIQNFVSDVDSPQVCENNVTFKAIVKGGRELQYRFIIDGNYSEDSGFIRSNTYVWKTKKEGKYKVELWVKDISFLGNYEDKATIEFEVEEHSFDPIKIDDVILDKENKLLLNETLNVKVISSGGFEPKYSFIVKKDNKVVEKVDYGSCNWVNFTPETADKYEIHILVKDKYSNKEYDTHATVHVEVFQYIPSVIDHVLTENKNYYLVGETISYEVITQNTSNTLVKYVLNISGQKIEEIDYVKDKKYAFTPKCSGIYTLEIYAKNVESRSEFDSMKEVKVGVYEAHPVTNLKIHCDREKVVLNETVTFTVSSENGKEVLYEFYVKTKGDWKLVQKYSRKNYYGFIPFTSGRYKILALTKSEYKKSSYEDYSIYEFTVS